MQKVISIRSTQSGLDRNLEEYKRAGWKVLSITKGPEWSRLFLTYKWTVVLEKEETKVEHVEEPKQVQDSGPATELMKAKELLSQGVITQEEFDQMKKKILEGDN